MNGSESLLLRAYCARVSYKHTKQRVISTPDVGVQWVLNQKATERGF